jgi:hypothetical protein
MTNSKKTFEAVDEKLPAGREFALSEVGSPEPIELISERDFVKTADLEAFMHEELEIRMAEPSRDSDLFIETPSVNGINMPMQRGVRMTIKRKYVEALCQARIITYVQENRNPNDPSDLTMVERSRLVYPFEVLRDPNPRGQAWLEAQLAQR